MKLEKKLLCKCKIIFEMKICQLYFLLNCVCSVGFAGLGFLEGEETCKVEVVFAGLGLLNHVCWMGFAGLGLLGGFAKWSL